MGGSGIVDRIRRALALRPGEMAPSLLLAAHLLLVIATYIAVKAVRDSLFLDRFSAVKLPYVIVGIAFGVGLFVAGYIRLARRVDPIRLTVGSLLLFASNLLLFWWISGRDAPWLYPVLYVWAGMFGAIAPAQVWTLANEVFTTRGAKRGFGILGAGGIAGAIGGGALTSALAVRVGTLQLLPILAVWLVLAAVAVAAVSRHRLPDRPEPGLVAPRHLQDSLAIIARSPHLRRIAGLVFVTALATTIADYQFKAVVSERFEGDALTAFFGGFQSIVGMLALGVQALLTSRLLKAGGLGATILILPFALLAGTVMLIPTLAVWAAAFLKGSDSALKHSVDRSTRELAYLPVSPDIKLHVKSAIDMVIDRLGDGTAGIILLLMATQAGLGIASIGWVNLVVIGLWIALALRLRRSYREELERSLTAGAIRVDRFSPTLESAETRAAVRDALASTDPVRVSTALDLASDRTEPDLDDALVRLANHPIPEIRSRAVAAVLRPWISGVPEGLEHELVDSDRTLLAEAIDFLATDDPAARLRHAEGLLARASGPDRGVWLALLIRRLGPDFRAFAVELIENLASKDGTVAAREAAASAVGLAPWNDRFDAVLRGLLEDPCPTVRRAAARSAGAIAQAGLLEAAVPLLGAAATRATTMNAFRRAGDDGVVPLLRGLERDETARSTRAAIPGALGRIGTAPAVAALESLLSDGDATASSAAVDALYRLRRERPGGAAPAGRSAVQAVLDDRVARIERYDAAARGIERDDAPRRVLAEAVAEASSRTREELFRIVGLVHNPERVSRCCDSFRSPDRRRRANAVEYLDTLTPRRMWRSAVRVLARPTEAPAGESAADDGAAARGLVADGDLWVAACAEAAASDSIVPPGEPPAGHGNGSRPTDPTNMQPSELRSVLERVVALRGVDLFEETPTEQLSRVASLARPVTLPAGALLCAQGDPAGDLYVLLDGTAIAERDGRPVGELGTGDAVGTWGLFDDEPRPASVRCRTEVSALRIDRGGFDELLLEQPEITRSLIRRIVRRLRGLTK